MFFVGARMRIHDPDAGLIGKAFSQSKNFQVELSEHNLFADSDKNFTPHRTTAQFKICCNVCATTVRN